MGEHISMHFPSFCTEKAPSIGVGTFIVLENPSSANEAMERMFITLDGPPRDGEGITVLIDGHTPPGAMPGISCPMSIPPKPPERVVVSIISTRGDHC